MRGIRQWPVDSCQQMAKNAESISMSWCLHDGIAWYITKIPVGNELDSELSKGIPYFPPMSSMEYVLLTFEEEIQLQWIAGIVDWSHQSGTKPNLVAKILATKFGSFCGIYSALKNMFTINNDVVKYYGSVIHAWYMSFEKFGGLPTVVALWEN